MNFDESSDRLNEIVKKLENNSISLEEAFTLYEEGVNISKDLYKKLNDIKGKVTILDSELNSITSNNDED